MTPTNIQTKPPLVSFSGIVCPSKCKVFSTDSLCAWGTRHRKETARLFFGDSFAINQLGQITVPTTITEKLFKTLRRVIIQALPFSLGGAKDDKRFVNQEGRGIKNGIFKREIASQPALFHLAPLTSVPSPLGSKPSVLKCLHAPLKSLREKPWVPILLICGILCSW